MTAISVTGLYFSYEGAEYENAFVKCGSNEIWMIRKNGVYQTLDELYRSMNLSQYGELFIKVKGHYSAINRTRYPNTHYFGTFTIERIFSHSADPETIESCRNG